VDSTFGINPMLIPLGSASFFLSGKPGPLFRTMR
jgi:hypothetical protein